MIDFQRSFHTGVRVGDLDRAMDELGAALGVTWAEPCARDQPVWTPGGGAAIFPLRFTYSVEGPNHVELLEGPAGSPWDGDHAPGAHHLGVWVDDVAGETTVLIDAGWNLVAAHRCPDEGFGGFTYVAPPSGFIVELVSAAAKPRFEAWCAGGSL
jgi:hypothetical protein